MSFQFFEFLNDECDQAIFIVRYVHHIKELPQQLSHRLHLNSGHCLPDGNAGLSDFALFAQHIRQLGIIWLDGHSAVLNGHLLLINK